MRLLGTFLLSLCMASTSVAEEGFVSLFDGKSLDGWDGNPAFWSVENGAITGRTTKDNPTSGNTFLIWREGTPSDFELRLRFRIVGGNSGIQYRSKEVAKWVMSGYQADFDSLGQWTGTLYEEKARGILARRGNKVIIQEDGTKQQVAKTTGEEELLESINEGGWNDYRIIARGNHLIHEVNGLVTVDVLDKQESKRAMEGLIALQLHQGPPMLVQFKDIRLKRFAPADSDGAATEQDAGKKTRKVVFVAGRRSHGYGAHEHRAGSLLLAKYLQQQMPNMEAVVYENGWPEDGLRAFEGADTVVVYCDGGGGHLLNPHIDEFDRLMERGVGLVLLHYAVETVKGAEGEAFMEWVGGYFEPHWSVNPHWTAKFNKLPEHPITRGVQPFEIHDEWYFHMRFVPKMENVTPILSAYPPASTMQRPDGAHSGNPHVRAAMKRGDIQHVAWAYERPNGGRGFGFTGGHVHWNWGDDNFRNIVLNAIVWTANGDVQPGGVGSPTPTRSQLEANQDFPKPEAKQQSSVRLPSRQRGEPVGGSYLSSAGNTSLPDAGYELPSSAASQHSGQLADQPAPRDMLTRLISVADDQHDPSTAIEKLDVHPQLAATLFAAEPMLLSPSAIDVDHRGRVWVCEVVNYRSHKDRRKEGDRILVLEDTDGDGQADTRDVFYQGRDVDSAHGICVLGNRVIISAGPHVMCLTDDNGDDRADRKELWFTNIKGVQHDHGIHAFIFGPDGKLYFNFGNEGRQLYDADGMPIVDMAGNRVVANGNPYQQGMIFRCNLDLSGFETLAWNFRNNWQVTVDSFGNIWQSDNDDDGNRGVRINYVMEFGNYGYRDEVTGEGWRVARTGMAEDVPTRHWHQNDPGVVPNLLQTGAGSPTGITVYEGTGLVQQLHGQLLHCDAGPSITRAYITRKDGAGYDASTVNLVHGARDQWYRPSDVKVAPDGSLFIADWYDPGVGGHRMGDLERGRIFRVTARGEGGRYQLPDLDLSTIDGEIEALTNPNFAMRYLAWMSLHARGHGAESPLRDFYAQTDNPRWKARVLWLLGKIPGAARKYVDLASRAGNEDLRVQALRMACQSHDVDQIQLVARLCDDTSAQVRRQCAISLRHERDEAVADLWARLASQHNGHDRWYLEALGIGAYGQWDRMLKSYLAIATRDYSSKAFRDIIWRSRARQTPELLAEIILHDQTPKDELARYFRAFDFLRGSQKTAALVQLVLESADSPHSQFIGFEALSRLQPDQLEHQPKLRDELSNIVNRMNDDVQAVTLIGRFRLHEHYPEALRLARENPTAAAGVEAMRMLLANHATDMIRDALVQSGDEAAAGIIAALGNSADNRAVPLLRPLLDSSHSLPLRNQAVRAMARIRRGAEWLVERSESEMLATELRPVAAAELSQLPWGDLRNRALRIYPLPPSKDNKPLPSLRDLADRRGEVNAGREVFVKAGTCVKCHQVRGEGKKVGPDLSEIGAKLSREALYESILYPSAGISHNFETYTLELTDGNIATGVLVSRTDDAVEIVDDEAIRRRFPMSEVDSVTRQPISLMPADLHQNLTEGQLVDLVEYMTTLRPDTTSSQ